MLSDRDRRDIQGLVLFGTSCPLLRYHFLHVHEAVGGRRLVRTLLEPGTLRVNSAGQRGTDEPSESLVYVGFTSQGLDALAMSGVGLNSFPAEYRQGARSRAAQVGDTGDSAPEQWLFDADSAHIAVMIYARNQDRLDTLSRELLDRAFSNGCSLVTMVDGEALKDYVHESGQHVTCPVHFGYSDGISQPEILPAPDRRQGAPAAVPPGMFLLGHPESADDAANAGFASQPAPIPALLMRNGTFGAFRMLEQDVDGYEAFLDRNTSTPEERELLAAKMCGRWRNGVPLSLSPTVPNPTPPLRPGQANEFDYVPTPALPDAIEDRTGAVCPPGSHIRRASPRSLDVPGAAGHRIRLIRRGMPYGPPYDSSKKGDGVPRGILGLFLCASLKDQFEFILRNSLADGLFTGGMSAGTFTYRAADGSEKTATGLSPLVRTRAATYLFFPSMTGLRYLSRLDEQGQTDAERESEDEAIEVVMQSMVRAIGHGTTRDAHTKHHGLVKATVEIAPDLPEALRIGVFSTPRTYQAYVRFSNGRPMPTVPTDAGPDVRGMAIKLFGVEGVKEAPDEKFTHDFVLASHPAFFVPDAFAYVDFLKLTTIEDKMRLFPELARSFRQFENPLSIAYFSQTPYALGPHVVKYVAHPIDPAEQAPISLTPEQMAARSPDYLRDAMAAHLTRRTARFELSVQLPPDRAAEQVDDATRLWQTLPIKLATITIAQQDFRNAAQDTLAETISFSPWHCLHEHRPLGSVNRTRRRVYRDASLLRHTNRATPPKEADGNEVF